MGNAIVDDVKRFAPDDEGEVHRSGCKRKKPLEEALMIFGGLVTFDERLELVSSTLIDEMTGMS